MHTIRTKTDMDTFLKEVQRMIEEDELGTFAFEDTKNAYSEHITQLRYFDDRWSALYSSEMSAIEWIKDVEEWVWNRRKDINKEIRKWELNIIPIKFNAPKRKHFKGRGDTELPTCPHCQEDLKRSYTYKWNPETKKGKYLANGWECVKCKYKQWD